LKLISRKDNVSSGFPVQCTTVSGQVCQSPPFSPLSSRYSFIWKDNHSDAAFSLFCDEMVPKKSGSFYFYRRGRFTHFRWFALDRSTSYFLSVTPRPPRGGFISRFLWECFLDDFLQPGAAGKQASYFLLQLHRRALSPQ